MSHRVAQHANVISPSLTKKQEELLCTSMKADERKEVRLKEYFCSDAEDLLDLLADQIVARKSQALEKCAVYVSDSAIVAERSKSAWCAVE
jgi:hypothetical protein